jgi:hypothetical protein
LFNEVLCLGEGEPVVISFALEVEGVVQVVVLKLKEFYLAKEGEPEFLFEVGKLFDSVVFLIDDGSQVGDQIAIFNSDWSKR